MAFARDVADRGVFMAEGRIVEQGPARELFRNPSEPAPGSSRAGCRPSRACPADPPGGIFG